MPHSPFSANRRCPQPRLPIARCRATLTTLLAGVMICALNTAAADKFVTPTGAGTMSGDDWANAYGSIQVAVNATLAGTNVIYLKEGTYVNAAQIDINSAADLTIKGGYAGSGFTLSASPSIVTRNTNAIRIFSCNGATVAFERVTVTGGAPAGNGGGLSLVNSTTALTDCVVTANTVVGGAGRQGIGIYASGGSLALTNTQVSNNQDPDAHVDEGGGIYATGVAVTVNDCAFTDNRVGANNFSSGGALNLVNGSAFVAGCTFIGNHIRITAGGSQQHWGGAIYAANVNPLSLSDSSFTGNYSLGTDARGGVIYLSGSGASTILACDLSGNALGTGAADIQADIAGSLTLEDSTVTGGSGRGLYKLGAGSLVIRNSLVAQQPQDGLQIDAGAWTLANSTLAANNGWGLRNNAGTGTVTDAIVWGNSSGGISGSATVSYSDVQEAHAGTGNLSVDPLFIAGYYLSVTGLPGQAATSPAIDAGGAAATVPGLETRTTRTDGAGDAGVVDLGYHYAGAAAGLANLVLYVNVGTGSDANDGLTAGTALKTIREALTRTIDGSTVHIAAGTYNAAAGEVFPLVIQDANVTLAGAGRTSTVVDADAAARVFEASGKAGLRFEALTITDGRIAGNGGGMYLINSATVIDDCLVSANTVIGGAARQGIGIYASGGSLTLQNAEVSGNLDPDAHIDEGGGLYATGVDVALNDSAFVNNRVAANHFASGGGVNLVNGTAVIDGCTFDSNYVGAGSGSQQHWGGAIYASGVNPLLVSSSSFVGNYALGVDARGAALCIFGGGASTVLDCEIAGNSFLGSTDDVYASITGSLTLENTVVTGGSKRGLYKVAAGLLTVINSLIAQQPSHGVQIDAGSWELSNSTLAANAGWGLLNSAAPSGPVTDAIVWGNTSGGISGSAAVTYSDVQEVHAGAGNLSVDPDFIAGFYLSVNGLPTQTTTSPAIDAGSTTAAAVGLDTRSTRTDGLGDTGAVDLGYHYDGPAAALAALTLWVDAATGDNANDGFTPATALKTITEALSRTIDGTTVHVQPGTYNAALGEVFPLVLQDPNVTVTGTDPTTTIVDADAANRVFEASGKTGIAINGLTITDGLVAGNGGAVSLVNSSTLIENCVITANTVVGGAGRQGIAVYVSGGSLTLQNTEVSDNLDPDAHVDEGGGLYANGVDLTLTDCTFANNRVGANHFASGGALNLIGGSAMIDGCSFDGNHVRFTSGGSQAHYGGAIYASNVNPLSIDSASFSGNYAEATTPTALGNVLYLSGSGAITVIDCDLNGNSFPGGVDDIYANITVSMVVESSRIQAGSARGIYKLGAGSLAVVNSLIAQQPSHGLQIDGGAWLLRHTTVADNNGWGLLNNAASGPVTDAVLWGNSAGGIAGSAAVTYSDVQEAHAGTGNLSADPLFIAGYYLSVNGLPAQGADSPAIDAGSVTAAAAGLDTRTTRTDGAGDSSSVDMGYHYDGGATGLANLVLYVDVVSGDDANDGLSWPTALKTIREALARAIEGSTINIAPGTYNAAAGEVFPLTVEDPGVALLGVDRDTTIVDANAAGRVFQASGKAGISFRNLTITDGLAAGDGGGLWLVNCAAVIDNCLITGNTTANASPRNGMGLFASGGALTLLNTVMSSNQDPGPHTHFGGAIYATGVDVTLLDSTFTDNRVGANHASYGGALHLLNGSAFIDGCSFDGNSVRNWSGGTEAHYGGAVYANGVSPLTISASSFAANYVNGNQARGGVLYLTGAGTATILDSDISDNAVAGSVEDVYNNLTGSLVIEATTVAAGSARGIYQQGAGSLALTNCLVHSQPDDGIEITAGTVTVASSTVGDSGGSGLDFDAGVLTVLNCILWGNAVAGIDAAVAATVTYTDSQEAHAGAGNITVDPLFTSSPTDDFTLAAGSPAINAGLNQPWMAAGTDLAGNPRIVDGTVDLGSYEAALFCVGDCAEVQAVISSEICAAGGGLATVADVIALVDSQIDVFLDGGVLCDLDVAACRAVILAGLGL